MAKDRVHSIEFKRQVVAEYDAGETLYGLAKRHDVCRNLTRVWVAKSKAGEFDEEVETANLLGRVRGHDRRAGAADRTPSARNRASKGALKQECSPRSAPTSAIAGPQISASERLRLMDVARSTYYDQPAEGDRDGEILNRIKAISDVFESYGYRRTCEQLRHQGLGGKRQKGAPAHARARPAARRRRR